MFLKLGKSRQRSSKRMFLSWTSRGRIHARSLSLIVTDRLHSICAADHRRAMRTACKRKLELRKSVYSSEALISEGSSKERQQQLKIGFCERALSDRLYSLLTWRILHNLLECWKREGRGGLKSKSSAPDHRRPLCEFNTSSTRVHHQPAALIARNFATKHVDPVVRELENVYSLLSASFVEIVGGKVS